MSTSGDAAEQVVRMSLEGVEAVAKISGKGALELTKILLAEMKKPQRTKGRASLMTMLRQNKPIKVFEIDDKSLKTFCEEAKRYGVMYHVLKDKSKNDHKCDIMVRMEDMSKVNRIFQRFGLGVNNKATVRSKVTKEKGEAKQDPERQRPEKSPEDKFIEELFKKPTQPEKTQTPDPRRAKTERSDLSEPTSETRRNQNAKQRASIEKRPSVKKKIAEINRIKKEQQTTQHTPKTKTKSKSKGSRSYGRT